MNFKTYKEPDLILSKQKFIIGILFSILWTFLFSFLYGVIIAISPIVYINFFITAGFGMFIGYGTRVFVKLFSITNKRVAIKLALINGVLGIYFSWVVYLLFIINRASTFENYFLNPTLVFNPLEVVEIIIEINKVGLWEIFGIPFNGLILWLIWLVEAFMIVVISTMLVKKQPQTPFSIKQNKWYKKYILFKDFEAIALQEKFKNELANNCISTIEALTNGQAYRFARISVFYLEGENQQYLTVENVMKDREGKKEDVDEVIHLLMINEKEAAYLIEKFKAKKAFIFDY